MATVLENDRLNIDPTDFGGLLSLMDRAAEFDLPFQGVDDHGDTVLLSINTDNVTTETFQDNGYCRETVYWRDGTVEELYHKS